MKCEKLDVWKKSARLSADPSKLHDLGWKHTVELEDGIGKMYAWYKESK